MEAAATRLGRRVAVVGADEGAEQDRGVADRARDRADAVRLGTPGIMPPRPTSPTVGFTPTTQFAEAGSMIEPLVSVPIPATHRLAAVATAVPELDSFGDRSSLYGFRVCPPRALQPAW